ncbi:YihY/virulence factor BrkB family protein [Paraliomyxa miuraensis]|uniref:YihY/virulence factor BrkB family protein n=1 Tax=Paraliomyxa miuraensis TaxID=376150 RepID=UPI00225BD232|nr:YihY/virulence factor BrkB family protein [Paraliomyxa miuraensis]MCX4245398.1 YihY/virulence factor BrkB family protein [Paraliomyxa miuraensis]
MTARSPFPAPSRPAARSDSDLGSQACVEPSARRVEPGDWPWSLGGSVWKDTLRAVVRELTKDQLVLVAAGVAFFAFLALFPALAATVALYGLLFDPVHVQLQMKQLEGLVPTSAHALVTEQLERLAAATPDSLSLGAIVALGVAIWSATKGSRGIIQAINLAYDRQETRGMVRLYLISLVLTMGSIVVFIVIIALAAGVPAMLDRLGLDAVANAAVSYGRWPLLLLVMLSFTAVVYVIAPNRKPLRWRWITPGSVLATAGLLVASGSFSLYVSNFGSYNEIYGSIGAVAVFMLWLYIASFVVLVGAELNAELERRVSS